MAAKCHLLPVLQWLIFLASRPTLVFARCPDGIPAHPILWKVTGKGSTAYLLASYEVSPGVMEPMPQLVQQAMNCSDAAYFELACPLSDPNMVNFMRHCDFYDSREEKGTIPERLPTDVTALQAGLVRLIDDVPAACKQQAEQLRPIVTSLGADTSRITVRALQERALRLLHPSACQQQSQAYEESLRRGFVNKKPVYGLTDVGKVCNQGRSSSIEEDQQLARQIVLDFSDKAWRDKVTSNFEAANELMRCGDLNGLTALQDVGDKDLKLPWLSEDSLSTTNLVMATGIMRGLQKFPGKTLFIALGAEHCVSRGRATSTLELLKANGMKVEPQAGPTQQQLDCQPSTMPLSAVQPPEHCIEPPDRFQKSSCMNFRRAFDAALGNDRSFGRQNSSMDCKKCIGHPKACSCKFEWTNDTAFRQLCAATKVGNVSGRVILLDVTQNPGSKQEGNFTSQKTVYGIKQECEASSCDVELLEEVKRRIWFIIGDEKLVGANVSFRLMGDVEMPGTSIFEGQWSWLLGVLITLAVLLCAAVVVCWLTHSKPKKKDKARSSPLREHDHSKDHKENIKEHVKDPPDLLLDLPRQSRENDEDWLPNPTVTEDEIWATAPPPVARNDNLYGQHDYLLENPYQSTEPYISRGQTPEAPPPTDWIGAPGVPPSAPPPPPPVAGNRQFDPTSRPLSSHVSFDHGNSSYPPIHDNSILTKAAELQAALGDAGTQAVQQIQLHAIRSWQEGASRPPSSHLLNSRQPSFAHTELQHQQLGSPVAGQMQMLGNMGGPSPQSFVTTAPVPQSQQGSFALQSHQQVSQQLYVPPPTGGVPYGSYGRLA